MGKSHHHARIPVQTAGQFLGFAANHEGKLKYMRVSTCDGEQTFKIPKEIRSALYRSLVVGQWLEITGEVGKEGDPVAYRVLPQSQSTIPMPVVKPDPLPAKCSILVCQKSDCQRRGAWAVIEALESGVADHPERIRVQPVGCLKNCKAGPNLVVMPAKARYSHVSPALIPALIDQHFPASTPVAASAG